MIDLAKRHGILATLAAHAFARWIALAFVSITIVGTAAYSYREINNELTASALSRREVVAQLMAITLAEKFGRLVDTGVSLATRVQFRKLVAEGKWNEAIEIMRTIPQDLPHIERLFLADINGTLKADMPALPGARGTNFAYREWFQGVSRNWRPYVSSEYLRAAPPRINVIAIAVPVKNPAGDVVGILALQLQVKNLLEWTEAVGMGAEESFYIVDSKGQLSFHSKRPRREGIIEMAGAAVVEKFRHKGQGVEVEFDPAEHEEMITAYATVPGYHWGVVTQQPTRAAPVLAARDHQLWYLLAGYGLILLLSSTAIFLMSYIVRERRHAEQRFQAVAETANDAVVSADHHGNITYFNPATERIFGYAAAETLGQPLTLLMPERFHDAHRKGLERFLAGGEARVIGKTVELVGRRKNGVEFPIDLSLASWKMDEETYFTGILRDISARKTAEEQLHDYATQLEATNKELEAFSYSVSHDLRAPLRSIDGFSQVLVEDYAGQLDESGKDHLNRVRAAALRMGELIDDMLQLSRVTRAEMRREPVDLSVLAESVVADLRRLEPQRQVEIVIAPRLRAEGDPQLLRIALVNLLSNAWKFTSRQTAARIELGAQDTGSEHAFYIRDNGVGFDMAYAGKLFGAFQRLHAMSEFPGTGIGLATVQRIINRHGGRIWAEGTVGQGATFYFALPTNRSA